MISRRPNKPLVSTALCIVAINCAPVCFAAPPPAKSNPASGTVSTAEIERMVLLLTNMNDAGQKLETYPTTPDAEQKRAINARLFANSKPKSSKQDPPRFPI